jgi:hypothetical protein
VFVTDAGNDYQPIRQSYELRELRKENELLKKLLQNAGLSTTAESNGNEESGERGSRGARRSAAPQRRFRTQDRIDNIYFGTPGLATMLQEV